MSIQNGKGEDIIRLSGLWDFFAKVAIALSLPVFMLGVSWAIWITTASFQHGQDIAVINEHLRSIKSEVHGTASRVGKISNEVVAKMKASTSEE